MDAVCMLPDPYPPTSGLRYSFPQLLGVLISDKINQLYHPPKPGPLLTQGHPHCLSTVCVQCLIDIAVEKPGLLPQFWTIPKNRPCTTASCDCFNVSLCPPGLPSLFHRDLCQELPTINFTYTSFHLRVFPRTSQQQCLKPSVSEP